MKRFECAKCGGKDLFIEEKSLQKGLYCADCGKWIKWLNKDDYRLVKRQIELFGNSEQVNDERNRGMNEIDFYKNQAHEVCELMCIHCYSRWIGVFPQKLLLKNILCEKCGKTGTIIKTGQTIEEGAEECR